MKHLFAKVALMGVLAASCAGAVSASVVQGQSCAQSCADCANCCKDGKCQMAGKCCG